MAPWNLHLILCAMAAWMLSAVQVQAQFTAPPRGLNTLTGRSLSFGYLNALRSATGTTAEKMAALNYDGVDAVILAFATLNSDGSLVMSGNAASYRSALITNAHARSKSVLFSVVGDFALQIICLTPFAPPHYLFDIFARSIAI